MGMFSKENRNLWDDTKLGFVFGFFGGFCNAVAIAILLFEIAPMSANWGGMAVSIGRDVKIMDHPDLFVFISIIFCFILGAYLGARWTKDYSPIPPVIMEGLLLMSLTPLLFWGQAAIAIAVGALAMGLQNGMSTQVSHLAVRTTHLTSTITDMGIGLARGEYKKALVKGSKIIIYMWGAIVGTVSVHQGLSGKAFSLAGGSILIIILSHTLLEKYKEGSLEQEKRIEKWFAQGKEPFTVPVSALKAAAVSGIEGQKGN